jgi:flap endonuclease-1
VLSTENLPPLKWTAPDEEGLVQFLVNEKSFSEERVRNVIKKINKNRGTATQGKGPAFVGC